MRARKEKKLKKSRSSEEEIDGRFFFFLSPLFPPPAQGGARSELARACKKVVGSRGQRGRAEHARAPCSPLAGPDSSRGGREKRKKGKKKKKKRACSSSSPSRPPVLEGERGLLLSLSLSLSLPLAFFSSLHQARSCSPDGTKGARERALKAGEGPRARTRPPTSNKACVLFFKRRLLFFLLDIITISMPPSFFSLSLSLSQFPLYAPPIAHLSALHACVPE